MGFLVLFEEEGERFFYNAGFGGKSALMAFFSRPPPVPPSPILEYYVWVLSLRVCEIVPKKEKEVVIEIFRSKKGGEGTGLLSSWESVPCRREGRFR